MSDYPRPPSGAYPPPPPPPPPPVPEPSQQEPERGWLQRNKILAVFVAGLAVAIGVGVAVSGGDDGDTQTASESETTEPDPETTERDPVTTDEPAVTTSTVPVPAGPTTVAMGQPVEVAIDEVEFDQDATYATVTLANPTTAEVEPGEFGMEPTNGLFVVVDAHVVVHPNSEGTYATSESDFNFVGGDGSVYEIGYATEFGQTLGYHDLSAGQQVSGKLIFDIPPEKLAGGKVQLDDTYEDYGEPLAFWTL